jgi:acetoin utilization protein AcuB
MKVRDCMTPDPACLAPEDTRMAAIELMESGDFRAVPVITDGKLVGIITDRDIRKHWQKPQEAKIGAIMSEHPICVSPEDSVNEAVRMLLAHKIGGLPVIEKDQVIGIITTTDILRAVLGLPEFDK